MTHKFSQLDQYEQKLVEGWEEVFKRSQLSLWILLALKDGPKHMSVIKQFMAHATINTIKADDQSMYRALRRFHDVEMIAFTAIPGDSGPDKKQYYLTETGRKVLYAFITPNIINVFYNKDNEKLIKGDY